MSIVTDTERRWGHDQGPRVTTTRRYQTRQPDTELAQLDRRIGALEGRARMGPAQRCRVVLLRRKFGWLVRDQAAGGAGWVNDARNLLLSIEREEAAQ